MVEKSTHLQVIPQKSTQNAASLPLQTCEKNQWSFLLLYDTSIDFNSSNNFSKLGSFAKVSVPLQFIISQCLYIFLVAVKEYTTRMCAEKKSFTHFAKVDKSCVRETMGMSYICLFVVSAAHLDPYLTSLSSMMLI